MFSKLHTLNLTYSNKITDALMLVNIHTLDLSFSYYRIGLKIYIFHLFIIIIINFFNYVFFNVIFFIFI